MPRFRPALTFQLCSILLMLTQSFAAPALMGLDAFGQQILLLSTVFLAQSVAEPALQNELNRTSSDVSVVLNRSHIIAYLAITLIVFGCSLVAIGGTQDAVLMLVVLVFCVAYTFLSSLSFAVRKTAEAAYGALVLLAVYALTFLTSHLLDLGPELILANAGGFGLASVFLLGRLRRQISMSVVAGRLDWPAVIGALSYRLPVVAFTGLATIVLGALRTPAAQIGEFRIFVAALNSMRYFNLTPLPLLQTSIQKFLSRVHNRTDREIAYRYVLSLLLAGPAVVVLLPIAFQIAFGEPRFTRLEIGLASLFVLIQPLGYLAFQTSRRGSALRTLLPATVAGMMIGTFAATLAIAGNPFLGMALAVVLAVAVYSVWLLPEVTRP